MKIQGLFILALITACCSYELTVYSLISWGGINGNCSFTFNGTGVIVSVHVAHVGDEIPPEDSPYSWAIHELPLRYDNHKRCDSGNIGKKILDLTSIFGNIEIGPLQSFYTDQIKLTGSESIWGKSLVIKGKKTTCGSIQAFEGESVYEARFYSPIGGSVWLRTWDYVDEKGTKQNELSFMTDVFNTFDDKLTSSQHKWNLYITDIIDDTEDYGTSCNFLTIMYDLEGLTECDEEKCPLGDLTHRFGNILVGSSRSRISKKSFQASNLPLPDLSGRRQLYIGVEDNELNNHVYACAKVRPIKAKKIESLVNFKGVKGNITIQQESVFSYTVIKLKLEGLDGKAGGFHVHELPIIQSTSRPKVCSDALGHYNPYKVDPSTSPKPGTGSHDQYELGDLSGKHGMLLNLESISATVIDHNLPLFGPRSIVGRSIVIHKDSGDRWICFNLRTKDALMKAVALYRYPFVGEIVMEQNAHDPLDDTTIHVGPLLYSDGTHNDTHDHEWLIHLNIPGKDFYDWQNRCRSTGDEIFNPYRISSERRVYRSCNNNNPERCMVGDLFKRLGPIKVAGSTDTALKTRLHFTDSNLPLSGPRSILKRSIVVFDKTAPKHRGNKAACTGIYRRFRYKGVVNKWKSASSEDKLDGKIEFIQETPYDLTNTEVELKGLHGMASGYHVHMVPLMHGLAFPCEAPTLYGHYNPGNINPKTSPPPGTGTDDQYEDGDLAGKYGTLDDTDSIHSFYNDTTLQLFGQHSVLGRSVIIHKKENSERWFCGSIGWGFSLSEAHQVAAIASFHHPKGFAWGYVRLRQLIYHDGSMSETYIEINLRHPGSNNKNVTRGHNWSVYVNPVGVDAAVKFYNSRCVASGYRWNPFLIQLAHPNDIDYYDKQCTPEFPLRCDAGDLSGRLGPIDVGDKRYVFMDKNLPLAGEHSAMNKAIIIHKEKGGVERFACGNIQPDHDIIKWVKLKMIPNFSPTNFMNEMREVLGSPEWFLTMDQQSVSFTGENECVSFKIIFMGPNAHQLEVDFSSLLVGGVLANPTITIPGVYPDPKRQKKVKYRTCGGYDEDELKKIGSKRGKDWWDLSFSGGSGAASNYLNIFYKGLQTYLILMHML